LLEVGLEDLAEGDAPGHGVDELEALGELLLHDPGGGQVGDEGGQVDRPARLALDDGAHQLAALLVGEADDGDVLDGGVGGPEVLQLGGGDVLALADDDVLDAAGDDEPRCRRSGTSRRR
jgi:hypothetical protein